MVEVLPKLLPQILRQLDTRVCVSGCLFDDANDFERLLYGFEYRSWNSCF
jgi:hypothetical protein